MSVNRERPHILVLPEDDANRQIAVGFQQRIAKNGRQFQILSPSGGWRHVRDSFTSTHNAEMRRYPARLMVLLVDFDESPTRLQDVLSEVDSSVSDRVFVLGAHKEPEDLKTNLRSNFEKIGQALAADCQANTTQTWDHALLKHNAGELSRMNQRIRALLF